MSEVYEPSTLSKSWDQAFAWWNNRRLLYNAGLIVAGLLAFACYAAEFELWAPHDQESEITLFTIGFQSVGYLVCMLIANLAFTLGPVSEVLLRPANLQRFRHWLFSGGLLFSIALPFIVPILFYFSYGPHA